VKKGEAAPGESPWRLTRELTAPVRKHDDTKGRVAGETGEEKYTTAGIRRRSIPEHSR